MHSSKLARATALFLIAGKLTLSENIADVAGLSASYDGYRRFYGDKPAPSAAGFQGDQRFFLAFAQIWRSKARPEALRNDSVRLAARPHAEEDAGQPFELVTFGKGGRFTGLDVDRVSTLLEQDDVARYGRRG